MFGALRENAPSGAFFLARMAAHDGLPAVISRNTNLKLPTRIRRHNQASPPPDCESPMLRTTLLPLACAAALAAVLPPPAIAQTTAAPADDTEALHNIQSNFAHMTPPPRSVESINKDLQQTKAAPINHQGGGRGGKGRMRQPQQQDTPSPNPDTKPQATQDVPAPSANPQPSATPATTP